MNNINSFPRIRMLSAISLGLLLAGCGGSSGGTTPPVEPPAVVDSDNDGVVDSQDAFPQDPNETVDTDSDGIGDNADTDDDGDGTSDSEDAFPLDASESVDTDGDGIGNNADLDDDGDGVADSEDALPLDPSETTDTDGDGIGNNADLDDDGDGVADSEDAFPLDSTETTDSDGDGIGNNADLDDDGDGVNDSEDAFPLDPSETIDTDGDGIGNNADLDDDGDGVNDSEDAFPLDSSETIDTDGDGIGNNADLDDDGDGVNDDEDLFPLDPTEWADSDGDGVGNNADVAPFSAVCFEQSQGTDGACYRELMTQKAVDSSLYAVTGGELFYYYLPEQRQVIGFNLETQRIDWVFDSARIANDDSVYISAMTYAKDQQKLYLAFNDNWIESVDLTTSVATPLYQTSVRTIKLVDAGERVFFVDNFNQAGFVAADGTVSMVGSEHWSNATIDVVYSQKHDKLYYLLYGILYSATVDESNWQITATNAITPSHSFYSGKLRLSPSEDLLSYDNVSQILRLADDKWMSRMSFNDFGSRGHWLADDHYLLTHPKVDDETTKVSRFQYSLNTEFDHYQPVFKQNDVFESDVLFSVNSAEQSYILLNQDGVFTASPYVVNNDSDGDGVANENDAFPNDASASMDSDSDGYADVVTEPSELIQDAFPNDSGCYLTEHGNNGECDPLLSMANYEPQIIGQYDGVVYIRDGYSYRVNRWSVEQQSYLNPLFLNKDYPVSMMDIELSTATGHLYALYQDGVVDQHDLKQSDVPYQAFSHNYLAHTIQAADYCVLVADDSMTTSFDNRGGLRQQITTPANFRYAKRVWHSYDQKLYFDQREINKSHLMSLEVEQSSCALSTLLSDEEIGFSQPAETVELVSENGQHLITNYNKVYGSETLAFERDISPAVAGKMVYWQDRFLFGLSNETDDGFNVTVRDSELNRHFAEFSFGQNYWFHHASAEQLSFYTFDGLTVGHHVIDLADTDGDDMPSWWELYHGLDGQNSTDGAADLDGDGLSNADEFRFFTSPSKADTDGDGLSDYREIALLGSNALSRDSDNDGITDDWEANYGLNLNDSSDASLDSDNDGYSNYQEFLANTDPNSNSSLPQSITDRRYTFEDQIFPANWRVNSLMFDYPSIEIVDRGEEQTNYALRLPAGLQISFTELFSGNNIGFDIQCADQNSGRLTLFHGEYEQHDWSQSSHINIDSNSVWQSGAYSIPEGLHTVTFYNDGSCDLYLDNLTISPLQPLIGSDVYYVNNYYDRLSYFDQQHNEVRVDRLVVAEDRPTFLLDQVVTSDGKLVIYEPHAGESLLLHYDPETMKKRHIRSEYFDSFDNRFGGLATHGDYVYATTVQDSLGNGHKGIVRFNLADDTSELFGDENYRDIAIHAVNGNNKLVAIVEDRIDVFDLDTMTMMSTLVPRGDGVEIDAIALDNLGQIYVSYADKAIRHLELSTGEIISMTEFSERVFDIDVDSEGKVLISTESFDVYRLDSELNLDSMNQKETISSGLAVVPNK